MSKGLNSTPESHPGLPKLTNRLPICGGYFSFVQVPYAKVQFKMAALGKSGKSYHSDFRLFLVFIDSRKR
jgi:hypothetical protein